ncbi:molecular chaperone HtpG [Synechococcus sp. PCC 7336]|uniref:molecular chaperone HtpG n=1 Tax=Synechococcus sp. PCC 7336 TaxID=195250 RepID=UPI00034D2826|nr:molecular chaperone HtpG [Synechococcus sp. PCC 7336]
MHEQGNISIHTENIFPIIKKSLYSDREIFLRELVSNGVDAINKLKWISYREDVSALPEPKITIAIDKDNRKLSISDTGLGMTADEVKNYINQVAFSSAEEFIEKYKGNGNEQGIIGHFGLGFYSSFMVSALVEIDTQSYRADAPAVHWSCDGSTQFTMDDSDRTDVGTTVTLTLTEEDDEFLEEARIRQLITKYCDFLSVPIEFGDSVVNKQEPLWVKSPAELKDEDYLEFYRYLYPFQEEPLFWIHINTDYPVIVKGILYFPKLRPDIDPNRGQIKLFCDQVYVTDNAEEVIPKFLMPLRGVIDVDGNDIPLNVSRSYLHNDRKVKRISDHIAKKVGDRLNDLYKEDYDRYLQVWPDISLFVKFGVMNSDKFYQRVKDILVFETSKTEEGQSPYVTLAGYLERNQEKQDKTVYYTNDKSAQRPYIELHEGQGLEVLVLDGFIDSHFTGFLERENSEVQFKRVDSELDDTLVDEDSAADIVDPATNKTRAETLEELFKSSLGKEQLSVKAQALKSEAVPAMILLPEALRRMQEMAAVMQQDAASLKLPDEHTLVVNTSHPLVRNLQELSQGQVVGSDDLPQLICNHIYDLAMMAQRNPDPDTMQSFLQRSNQVLTRLTEKALA